MKKKSLIFTIIIILLIGILTACTEGIGASSGPGSSGGEEAAKESGGEQTAESEAPASTEGSVYYLNFKPEQDEAWQELAKRYTELTGVEVEVVTAASGEYESTLINEMGKEGAPTLFRVNGAVGLANWRDFCYDLSDTELYKNLTSKDFAIMDGEKVAGVAYVIESYGIIVNKKLLEEAGYKVEDIKSFSDLKAIAEDITERKDDLEFSAFTSAGMQSSSDWRFKTHLANLPIYFEYQEDGIAQTNAIKGTYLDNYRAIWDLYINNSTCEPNEIASKSIDDSRNEFLEGQAVFYQNGSWEYSNLVGEELFSDEDLVMIPIYIGVGDEEKQGMCTGTENYWCINSDASEADIKATLDFVTWCVTSEEGTDALANKMNFTIPFKHAVESNNIFVKQDAENTAAGLTPISWNFTTIPSEAWKNNLGEALIDYAADQSNEAWDDVVAAFVDGWANEYSAAHN